MGGRGGGGGSVWDWEIPAGKFQACPPAPDWALEPALREASGQRAPALASAPRGTPTFISLISKSLNQIPQALQGLFLL